MSRPRSTKARGHARPTARTPNAQPRRRRRAGEETRERILEAAERALVAAGPDGVRLAELARELGITHPAILHHFGSREALLEAVVSRALAHRYAEVIARLTKTDDVLGTARELIETAARAFERQGTSRLVAWLALGADPMRALGPPGSLVAVATVVDGLRGSGAHVGRRKTTEASSFAVHLGALVLLADPILGPAIWTAQGRRRTAARDRAFRAWFATALRDALLPAAAPAKR